MTEVPPPPGGSPAIIGTTVVLEPIAAVHADALRSLDWLRSLHPVMAGPLAGPRAPGADGYVVRAVRTGELVGVLDARPLPGYQGVTNVSIFTDGDRAGSGLALEAYGRLVLHLFQTGTRIVHHEVLEMNRPIQRALRGMGLEPTARLRSHAYVAGRFWDVLVFSLDRPTAESILGRVFARRSRGTATGPERTIPARTDRR